MLARYLRVVQINREPGQWCKQSKYPGSFPTMTFRLADKLIAEMLAQKHWLATRAPKDGNTDRIAFDLDAKTSEAAAARTERYWQLRALMGEEHIPLVFATPSGHGLRVVYRIPRTRLSDVVVGGNRSLVPDVLRAAGLIPEDGAVEVYPRTSRPDRLPLGRRMPVLDPATLEPLPAGNVGDAFDLAILESALVLVEQWYDIPCDGLLLRLRTLDREPASAAATRVQHRSTAQTPSVRRAGDPDTTSTLISVDSLLRHGLTAPSTRQRAEWLIGLEFVQHPEAHAEFGLSPRPTAYDLACAIARWLALRNNSLSQDWNTQLARLGSVPEAEAWFVEQHLRVNPALGTSFIDRLSNAARAGDPELSFALALSRREADAVLALADLEFPSGRVARYRFECWMFAFALAVKSIVLHNRKLGIERRAPLRDNTEGVCVEIHSQWMRAWPYGAGEDASGIINYRRYEQILRDHGLARLHRPHRATRRTAGGRPTARVFVVPAPDLDVRIREAGIRRADLRRAIDGMRGYGDAPLDVAEAYHALYVSEAVPDLRERYGARTSERIKGYVDEISHRIDVRAPSVAQTDAPTDRTRPLA